MRISNLAAATIRRGKLFGFMQRIQLSDHFTYGRLFRFVLPSIVLLIMGALGYVSELGTVGQSPETALNMCWLVAGLYVFSGILMFVSIAFIYNLNKPTLAQMSADLNARHAAEGVEAAAEAPQTVAEDAAQVGGEEGGSEE